MRLSLRSSSAGAAPRAPSISDQTSPPMTTATAGTTRLPQNQQPPPYLQSRKPAPPSPLEDNEPPPTDSCTGTPRRETLLHELAAGIGVEHRRGGSPSTRIKSCSSFALGRNRGRKKTLGRDTIPAASKRGSGALAPGGLRHFGCCARSTRHAGSRTRSLDQNVRTVRVCTGKWVKICHGPWHEICRARGLHQGRRQ